MTVTHLPRQIDLSGILDLYFGTISEVEGDRPVSGGMTWRASKLGGCMRAHYLSAVDKVPQPPIDARMQRIFQVGHLTGELIERAFRALGILITPENPGDPELSLSDAELNIGANVDFILGGEVREGTTPLEIAVRAKLIDTYGPVLPVFGVELKSKSSKSFWWASKKNEPVAGENQLIQAAVYDILAQKKGLGIESWSVLSVSKDDLVMAQTPVEAKHRDMALERLSILNAAKCALDAPCDCFTMFGGKGWKYCPYGVSESECCRSKR